MNRVLVTLLLLLESASLLACTVPRGGEKYNSLIELESVSKSSYKYQVPKNISGHEYDAEPFLTFYKKDKSGYWAQESALPIEAKTKGGLLYGSFELEPIKNQKVMLTIYWPANYPGLCATFAKIEISNAKNKT